VTAAGGLATEVLRALDAAGVARATSRPR